MSFDNATPFTRRVLFLGGNGHTKERLAAACEAVDALPKDAQFELFALSYPGFEGRSKVDGFEEFLDLVARDLELSDPAGTGTIYATGIGALIALALRARGDGPQRRLILQGGVLWGLEGRLFAKLMRGPMPHVLRALFAVRPIQSHFAKKHFLRTPSKEEREAFFRGYAQCSAFADLFQWLKPSLLRGLERAFAARPAALGDIDVWWGQHDSVVGLTELEETQAALDTNWPVQVFPNWAHYPMLDTPTEWVQALVDALAPSTRR